jgi:hypothetical protein
MRALVSIENITQESLDAFLQSLPGRCCSYSACTAGAVAIRHVYFQVPAGKPTAATVKLYACECIHIHSFACTGLTSRWNTRNGVAAFSLDLFADLLRM